MDVDYDKGRCKALTTPTHLIFDSNLGRKKPETIIKRENSCPFCDREHLQDIIAEKGSMILLKNKFPVLQEAFQTVLIETDECNSDLSIYPKAHLYQLLQFGIENWMQMMENKEYRSVCFFRNYGPLSGGSIAHPHSQIIAFKEYDYLKQINKSDFTGLTIERRKGVELNISTKPRVGFYEFNVILEEMKELQPFADYIQMIAHFILHHFIYRCNSYNLFFYYYDHKIIVKIVPRFVTSPLFIGYSIPQVPNNLEEVVHLFKSKYR